MDRNDEAKDTKLPPASNKTGKPRLFYGYVIVGAAFLTMVVLYGVQYSFGVFFKPMLDEFGWSRALTSGVYSMNVVVQGLFTIVAGRLSDRFGPKIVVIFSGFLLCLGYSLMSRINAVWQIYLFYGVFISLGSCLWVPLASTCARWFIRRRGMMSGIISSGIGFGMVIFPPLANLLIHSYGWRLSYIIMGVSSAAVMLISAQFLLRDPSQKGLLAYGDSATDAIVSDSGRQGYSLKEAIRTRQFWIICLTFFTTNFCVQGVIVHMVPHATDIGIAAAAAATIISAIGVLSITTKIGVGTIIDKLGGKPVLRAVPVLLSLSFLWLLPANQLWMFYLFAIIFAIGYGGSSAIQSPIVAEYFGLKSHGTIMGMILIGNFAGGALSPLLAGRIFDTSGSYRWAFIICIIVSLVAFTSTLFLRPARKKEPVISRSN
jgi:MFS family permease